MHGNGADICGTGNTAAGMYCGSRTIRQHGSLLHTDAFSYTQQVIAYAAGHAGTDKICHSLCCPVRHILSVSIRIQGFGCFIDRKCSACPACFNGTV